MEVTLGILAKARSSGLATELAIVSALAPGRKTETLIVGKSISGSDEIGRSLYARTPSDKKPITKSTVALGCCIKTRERLIIAPLGGKRLSAVDRGSYQNLDDSKMTEPHRLAFLPLSPGLV